MKEDRKKVDISKYKKFIEESFNINTVDSFGEKIKNINKVESLTMAYLHKKIIEVLGIDNENAKDAIIVAMFMGYLLKVEEVRLSLEEMSK